VQLLEQSPQSRIPEIAAKTLANLAANDSNQTAIRLAGVKASAVLWSLCCVFPDIWRGGLFHPNAVYAYGFGR
jgi:hypothetical protein